MELTKIQARGQITLPRAIRKAADFKPGDVVGIKVTGPGRVEIHVVSRLTLAETFEKYRIEEPIDWARDVAEMEALAAEEVLRD
jgi:AbrB family looped-hinge helix DNA binding protein